MKRTSRNFSIKPKIDWDSTLNLPQTSLPLRSQLNDENFLEAVSSKSYEKFCSKSSSHGPDFTLIDGPPFANGDLHVGTMEII